MGTFFPVRWLAGLAMAYEIPPAPYEPGPRVSTSLTEIVHLVVSIVILSVIFGFLLIGKTPDLLQLAPRTAFNAREFYAVLPSTLLIVLPAFVLHELSHKILAQRYYLWAEYRAQFGWLGIVLVLNLLGPLPIPFVLPGFVQIVGDATIEDNGKISAVGPATNLVIGYAALPFLLASGTSSVEVGTVGDFVQLLVYLNAFLAVFNLLPISVLDGAKVARWNLGVYMGLMAAALLLLFLTLPRVF